MNIADRSTGATFRRFEEGERASDWDLEEKIFQADTSYKCPTYIHKTPPCQGSCPSGHEIRGWLAIARGMDKPAGRRDAVAGIRLPPHGTGQPVPGHDGPGLPRAVRGGVQPQRGRRVRRHQRGRAICRRLGQRQRPSMPKAGRIDTGRKIAVIGGGPAGSVGGLFPAAGRPRCDPVRKPRRAGRHDALRHPRLPDPARHARQGNRADHRHGRRDPAEHPRRHRRVGGRAGSRVSTRSSGRWARNRAGRCRSPAGTAPRTASTGSSSLDAFNQGYVLGTAQKVVVVGGGDTSIDVASVARRLGHITSRLPARAQRRHACGFHQSRRGRVS